MPIYGYMLPNLSPSPNLCKYRVFTVTRQTKESVYSAYCFMSLKCNNLIIILYIYWANTFAWTDCTVLQYICDCNGNCASPSLISMALNKVHILHLIQHCMD